MITNIYIWFLMVRFLPKQEKLDKYLKGKLFNNYESNLILNLELIKHL